VKDRAERLGRVVFGAGNLRGFLWEGWGWWFSLVKKSNLHRPGEAIIGWLPGYGKQGGKKRCRQLKKRRNAGDRGGIQGNARIKK